MMSYLTLFSLFTLSWVNLQSNVPLQRRLATFASPPVIFNSPLQGGCYAAIAYRLIRNI
jgi:hypothetical protein